MTTTSIPCDEAGGRGARRERLFFALVPDAQTRSAIERVVDDLQARAGAVGARRTAAARWHLTLRFLGELQPIPDALLHAAQGAGGDAAADVAPFELALDCAGAFGRGRSCVWWLGCAQVPPALSRLHGGLARGLEVRGVDGRGAATRELQPFKPHVTIARGADRPPPEQITPIVWPAESLALIRSAADGPAAYTRVAQWRLGSSA